MKRFSSIFVAFLLVSLTLGINAQTSVYNNALEFTGKVSVGIQEKADPLKLDFWRMAFIVYQRH